ncbi:hypothetical protein AAK894_01420 [Lachnospiraceae bacterium 46-61]
MSYLFDTLTIYDWIFTAIVAYFVTSMILNITNFIKGIKRMKHRQMISMDYRIVDFEKLLSKCRELFPIDTVYFHGRIFRSGMRVKITTMQKTIIIGEIIGKNKMDLLCIKTQNQIIAHALDKIEEMEQY